ncbi:MAG TPA: DUF11 domain-containing protein, partial [Thermoanaerobaculia bacterium]|nr:DUF11 domain-containing protein [Thermoanaerobaculia bacterium]
MGPSDATNVVVTDPLPAAVTYVSDTCGGSNVPPWTWNVGTLAAGATVSCDLVVSIDPNPPGSISNTASVTSDVFDDDLSNNSATEETTLDNVPPEVVSVAALPSGQLLTDGVLVTQSITGLEVAFSEAMQDPPGDADPDDVTNPANYLLVRPGANGTFQTVSCAAGLAGDDVPVAIQSVAYDAGTFTAVLDLGSPLPVDDYRFFACGSATLRDLAGNPLAGGDDFIVSFRMASLLEIPTLAEVGLLLLALLLALASLWLLGRRRGGFGPTAAAGLLAVALLGAAAAPASAQVVIDELTTVQGPLADPGTSSSTATTAGTDVLGLDRDLVVVRSAGAGTVTAEVTGGELTFTAPASTTGELLATWDGQDADATALDPTGLGGVDLTDGGAQGGFRLVIEEAAAGTYLLVTVYQDADNVSRAARVLPAIGSQTAIFIDFAELVTAPGALGPADLTAAGAITLLVGGADTDPAPTLVLSQFETAPPAVAALKVDRTAAGDPIAGAVNPGDTIRYRITIATPGAGAEAVDLEDLVSSDPNLSLVAGSVRTTPVARRDHYRTF